MMRRSRKLAGMAIFSAMAYVAALISFYIPNVNLNFVVVFFGGLLFGVGPGIIIGALGMFLWTTFNPLGMAEFPVMLAQVAGMSVTGLLGGLMAGQSLVCKYKSYGFLIFLLLGLLSGLIFQLFVSGTFAALYGPFWPQLYSNMAWALLTIVSNAVIFSVCYPIAIRITTRERTT